MRSECSGIRLNRMELNGYYGSQKWGFSESGGHQRLFASKFDLELAQRSLSLAGGGTKQTTNLAKHFGGAPEDFSTVCLRFLYSHALDKRADRVSPPSLPLPLPLPFSLSSKKLSSGQLR